jgi:hypothetical protein
MALASTNSSMVLYCSVSVSFCMHTYHCFISKRKAHHCAM